MSDKIKNQTPETAQKTLADFLSDYDGNVELAAVNEVDGQHQFVFKPSLATTDYTAMAHGNLPIETRKKIEANVMYRDQLRRGELDLTKPDVVNESPKKIYERMRSYYRSKDVFGSFIDTLVNLAISGFENDCDELEIKEFYDNWCQDVDIEQVLEWIYQEFYTSGFVRTYKVLGRYEPQINRLSKVKNAPKPKVPKKTQGSTDASYEYDVLKALWEIGEYPPKFMTQKKNESYLEFAARKKIWSRGFVPVAYTVLNPTEITIEGSILFNQTRVTMEPSDELKDLVNKAGVKDLTDAEKKLLDNIPPELKSAIKNNEAIQLDPELVGEVDYRRMPYEKYPLPKGARAFESVEYKEALKEADYSTIDGIVSEVLVITIGDKDNPVTREEDLRKVATLFNTSQKAFNVVWNHTLKVERVSIDNVEQIFGVKKFEQVERDISGSFGLPRALLDGIMYGDFNADTIALAIQAVIAELEYGRRQVTRWLYNEYKQIAEAFGFDKYPTVRWNSMILKDEIAYKTLVEGLVDRRIISYDTAHKLLGFDPTYEQERLAGEVKKVLDGTLGLHGSPYQQPAGTTVEKTQKTPKGTPSEGRPKNQPNPKTPDKPTPKGQTDYKTKKAASLDVINELTLDEIGQMQQLLALAKRKKEEELANFLLEEEDNREDTNVDQEV